MAEDELTIEELEEIIHMRVVRLNARITGLVIGLAAGLGIFIATLWLLVKGGEVVGPNLSLLGQYFIGYRVTFMGSLIGFGYGLVLGYFLGYLLARIYNRILDLRGKPA